MTHCNRWSAGLISSVSLCVVFAFSAEASQENTGVAIAMTRGADRTMAEIMERATSTSNTSKPAMTSAVRLSKSSDAAQTPALSFTGATLSGVYSTGSLPPDSMGAAGPSQYILTVNGRFISFTKSGVADGVMNTTPDVFFDSIRTKTGTAFTTHPNVRYDRLSGRWFIVMIDVSLDAQFNTINPNQLLIAFSDSGSSGAITLHTSWTFFSLAAPPTCFANYPTLGIDNNALYIGTVDDCPSSFTEGDGYVIPKAALLAGSPTAFRFALVASPSSSGPLNAQGVDNYDPLSTEGYFIGVDNNAFGLLDLVRVSNPGSVSPAPTVSASIPITVGSTSYPKSVPHLGNTGGTNGLLDALDDRLFAAHIRNGRLWTAHNIAVTATGVATSTASGRNGVRWYELSGIRSSDNGGVPSVVQSGTLFDSAALVSNARQFWMPSIMVNGQGHAAVGFSTAGTPFHIDAGVAGRWSTDPLGSLQSVALYTASVSAYNPPSDPGPPRRWGAYSYTSLDPLDDMTMWSVQEFCDTTNSYGVQVVKLQSPPPATPASASPATLASNLASTTTLITATSSAGSGFFDPGPDLPPPAQSFHHVAASVSGGVTVNSVAYVSPTSVMLDLNTTAATPGPVTITITNPDGQSVAGNGILSIGSKTTPAANLVATAASTTSINLTWNAVAGAASYNILRKSQGSAYLPLTTSSVNSFTDTNLTAGTTYVYKVQAVVDDVGGPASNPDLATTILFTDDPSLSGSTRIKAIHVVESRSAVNAVRVAAGLPEFTFTDTPGPAVFVKGLHIKQLRDKLNEALAALTMPGITLTNTIADGTPVRALDVNEIRNATK